MTDAGSTLHQAFDLTPRLTDTRVQLDLDPKLFLEGPLESLTFCPLAMSRAISTTALIREWYVLQEQKLHNFF